MSRPVGSKNTVQLPARYEGGFGAVNFWMSILLRAKLDYPKWHYAKEMVNSFVKHQDTTLQHFLNPERRGKNIDSLEEAWWICEYVKGQLDEDKRD